MAFNRWLREGKGFFSTSEGPVSNSHVHLVHDATLVPMHLSRQIILVIYLHLYDRLEDFGEIAELLILLRLANNMQSLVLRDFGT
jgi:hypothetical protein